jgi:hypothetical protein
MMNTSSSRRSSRSPLAVVILALAFGAGACDMGSPTAPSGGGAPCRVDCNGPVLGAGSSNYVTVPSRIILASGITAELTFLNPAPGSGVVAGPQACPSGCMQYRITLTAPMSWNGGGVDIWASHDGETGYPVYHNGPLSSIGLNPGATASAGGGIGRFISGMVPEYLLVTDGSDQKAWATGWKEMR